MSEKKKEPWVKFNRFGLKVERLECSGGPFRHIVWQFTFGRDWQFDTLDWSVSRRVEEHHWRTVTPALRCCLCHRWTLGCDDHWLCGLCPQCKAWEEQECEECKERSAGSEGVTK